MPRYGPKVWDIFVLSFHHAQLCLIQIGFPKPSLALGEQEEAEDEQLSFRDIAQKLHTSLGVHVISLRYVLNTTIVLLEIAQENNCGYV